MRQMKEEMIKYRLAGKEGFADGSAGWKLRSVMLEKKGFSPLGCVSAKHSPESPLGQAEGGRGAEPPESALPGLTLSRSSRALAIPPRPLEMANDRGFGFYPA